MLFCFTLCPFSLFSPRFCCVSRCGQCWNRHFPRWSFCRHWSLSWRPMAFFDKTFQSTFKWDMLGFNINRIIFFKKLKKMLLVVIVILLAEFYYLSMSPFMHIMIAPMNISCHPNPFWVFFPLLLWVASACMFWLHSAFNKAASPVSEVQWLSQWCGPSLRRSLLHMAEENNYNIAEYL